MVSELDFGQISRAVKGKRPLRTAAIHGAQVWAAANLKRLGLEMRPDKTRITNFEEGVQFIGWFFVQNQMFKLK